MGPLYSIGIILLTGFIFGEFVELIKLPKVTGYILAGIFLNPEIVNIIPANFTQNTEVITEIALAFIAFSVGGTLYWPKIKKLGKTILTITFFEAQFAAIFVAAIFIFVTYYFVNIPNLTSNFYIPLAFLIAALAAPTDPSATLAVLHEYKTKGSVSSTIMGVAAFDDILGILNYSLAVVIAIFFIKHTAFTVQTVFIRPLLLILNSIFLGLTFGLVFNTVNKFVKRETEGMLIVLVFGFMTLCYGIAAYLQLDKLLALVFMGVMVVNFNCQRILIFNMLERYTEELIFVLFFTISGMHLDFSVIINNWGFILLFVLFRGIGKYLGVIAGGYLSKASPKIKRYVAGGLIPQGGIVIGLALLINQQEVFAPFSVILINIIIGATVIHEIFGPILAKYFIAKAGEIKKLKK